MPEMTREEESLLMYLETRAVDHDGKVDLAHMNDEDHLIVARWAEEGFIVWWRRLLFKEIRRASRRSAITHHVNLGEQALKEAHRLRTERIGRGLQRTEERKILVADG